MLYAQPSAHHGYLSAFSFLVSNNTTVTYMCKIKGADTKYGAYAM